MIFSKTSGALILLLLAGTGICSAQSVIINEGVSLPMDSITRVQVVKDINGFIGQKEQANNQNTFVLKDDLLETSALLDEMKGAEQNSRLRIADFYKAYLSDVVKINDSKYLIRISYIGEDKGPVVGARFKLLAKLVGGRFYFSSPLKYNTASWKTRKIKNITYRYKDTLNTTDAKAYQAMVSFYDKKLKAPGEPTIAYYCDNFSEVQKILGIDFKSDYEGVKYNNLTAHENKTNLVLNGWNDNANRFDSHDLFHERLRTVLDNDVINRAVDEGCAYLYGGSWGITWPVVLNMFKKYAAENPNANWLQLYIDTKNFSDGGKPLKSGYVINALIIQELEREKGFSAVMELLSCGKRQKGDDNYFKVLKKLTGINKANFNVKAWEYIKNARIPTKYTLSICRVDSDQSQIV